MALLLLLFLLPIVEMYLLIRLGGYLGAWPTIALVILAGAAGIAILRRQGPAALNRVAARLQSGELPALEVAEGALLALAGLLLLIPGFMTDLAGLLLLVPGFRRRLAGRLVARAAAPGRGPADGPVVIEGEFESRPSDPPEKLRDRT
jgi:UPF0716 protein FxsA